MANTVVKTKRQNLKDQEKRDHEKVKGIFRFYEVPGGQLSFVYKKYKGDPIEKYDMIDGETYSVPLCVAKHLNKNGWYPVHAYNMNEDGKPSVGIGKKVQRFGFQSLEFVDGDDDKDMEPSLIEEVFEIKP